MARSRNRSPDPLATYAARRRFNETEEPPPGNEPSRAAGSTDRKRKTPAAGGLFVVQLHHARRRHFDLRLELDGVLKSWAITRSPSADPRTRRLAVRTEDHPLAYAEFEGTIPEGQYGAGEMVVWDRGRWHGPTQEEALAGIEAGHLKIRLDGTRMRGGWSLTRLPGEGRHENWLLVKERDAWAEGDDSLGQRFTGSVLTKPGGGLAATEGNGAAVPPAFIPPMLCTLRSRVPGGPGWQYEMKYDGYRMQIALDRGGSGPVVAIRSRNGRDWTASLPAIAGEVRELPARSAILDGEIVVLGAGGLSDFGALQEALSAGRDRDIVFIAFDLLRKDGHDLRPLPLRERRRQLEALVEAAAGRTPSIRLAPAASSGGPALLQAIAAAGGEGLIAKRIDAPYRSARSSAWVKVKAVRQAEAVVVGYVPSANREAFASLLVAEDRDGSLEYAGRVGTGFSARRASEIALSFEPLRRSAPPAGLAEADRAPRNARWLAPHLKILVAFSERTRNGFFRAARFLDRLPDREPSRITASPKSKPAVAARQRPAARPSPAKARSMSAARPPLLTNPDRVVYPGIAVTKADVAGHYRRVAHLILPHLEGRPVSVIRAPDGIDGEIFFQRHPMPAMKAGIEQVPADRRQPYMRVTSADGLATIAQFGGIELHGWGARLPDLDHPDRMVFDLDPGDGVAFREVTAAALLIRDVLRSAGVKSFAMLTGGKGIHVLAPLDQSLPWSDVEAFAEAFARRLARLEPHRFIAKASKSQRKGRIFIDWLRNKKTATAVLPYSLRARPGAPVAIPVAWSALATFESSAAVTISDQAALNRTPWRGFFSLRQSLSGEARAMLSSRN